MVKIALDAGHGLNTPGKETHRSLGRTYKEWTLNDRVASHVEKLLKGYEGVKILRVDDRTGKRDVPLRERTNKANGWGADLYLSIHHNAGINLGTGGGVVVYKYPRSTRTTDKLRNSLYEEIIKQNKLKGNRYSGLGLANFHVLRETRMAALLLENGFMDSKTDYPLITKKSFSKKTAVGIVNFLKKNYNIRKKGTSTTKPKKPKKPSGVVYYAIGSPYNTKAKVSKLQRDLESLGFSVGKWGTNGIFGQDTRNAVMNLQRRYGLAIDGSAGPETLAKIRKLRKNKSSKHVPSKKRIAEDGWFGPATARRAQEVYGLKIVDGIVSGQPRNASTRNIPAAKYGTSGSNLILAMQKEFGVPKRLQDRKITVPSRLVLEMQKYYGTPQDSVISGPSMVIKEWQKALNKGRRK